LPINDAKANSDLDLMTATEGAQENTISLTSASLNYDSRDSLQTIVDEKIFGNNLLTAVKKISPDNIKKQGAMQQHQRKH
jgi:hypothetical protein